MKMKDVFNLPVSVSEVAMPKVSEFTVEQVELAMKKRKCYAYAVNNHDRLTEENEALKAAIKSFYKACETENETEVQSSIETMMNLVDCLELTNNGE